MRRVVAAAAAAALIILVFIAYSASMAGVPWATRVEGFDEACGSLPTVLPAYVLYNGSRAAGVFYSVVAAALGIPGNCTLVDVTMVFSVLRCGGVVVRNGSGILEIIVPPEAVNGSAREAAQRLVEAIGKAFPGYSMDVSEEELGLGEAAVRVVVKPVPPGCGSCTGLPASIARIRISRAGGLHAFFSISLPERTLEAARPGCGVVLRGIYERHRGARVVVENVHVFYRPVELGGSTVYVPEAVFELGVYRSMVLWYSYSLEVDAYPYILSGTATAPP